MAEPTLQTKGGVVAGNGLGPKTYVASVATGTITMEAAAEALAVTHTVAGIEGVADGDHIAVQGTADFPTIGGVTLVATFVD
jgi:hypothetical protein